MNLKLTIIIPCYNCSSTLEEAVNSCYVQGLKEDEFEIIMVDDNSSDSTWQLMKDLKKVKGNILLFQHEKNKGGGAARNTAVKNASADVVFCLDSDDILAPNMLSKMLQKLINDADLDGVVFQGGRSFTTTIKKFTYSDYGLGENTIHGIERIFEGKNWGVGVNFMYTKKAFDVTGGYPEYHNFDTQGFGARFLANNLRAAPVQGTYFYHRQFAKKESYFERAHNNGEFSLNHFFIFNEIAHLLPEEMLNILYESDLFQHSHLHDSKKISTTLQKLVTSNPRILYNTKSSNELYSRVFTGNRCLLNSDYDAAIVEYSHALVGIPDQFSKNIDLLLMLAISAKRNGRLSAKKLQGWLDGFVLKKSTLRPSLLTRIKKIPYKIYQRL